MLHQNKILGFCSIQELQIETRVLEHSEIWKIQEQHLDPNTQIIQKSIPHELELLADWNLSGFLIYGFPEYSTRERKIWALDFWSLFINLNHIHHKRGTKMLIINYKNYKNSTRYNHNIISLASPSLYTTRQPQFVEPYFTRAF